MQLFKTLFQTNPELVDFFPFKNEPDLFNSPIFLKHALKVTSALGQSIDKLEDLETLAPLLRTLGFNHKKYGVRKEHYPMIVEALIDTLSFCLPEDQFRGKVKRAW